MEETISFKYLLNHFHRAVEKVEEENDKTDQPECSYIVKTITREVDTDEMSSCSDEFELNPPNWDQILSGESEIRKPRFKKKVKQILSIEKRTKQRRATLKKMLARDLRNNLKWPEESELPAYDSDTEKKYSYELWQDLYRHFRRESEKAFGMLRINSDQEKYLWMKPEWLSITTIASDDIRFEKLVDLRLESEKDKILKGYNNQCVSQGITPITNMAIETSSEDENPKKRINLDNIIDLSEDDKMSESSNENYMDSNFVISETIDLIEANIDEAATNQNNPVVDNVITSTNNVESIDITDELNNEIPKEQNEEVSSTNIETIDLIDKNEETPFILEAVEQGRLIVGADVEDDGDLFAPLLGVNVRRKNKRKPSNITINLIDDDDDVTMSSEIIDLNDDEEMPNVSTEQVIDLREDIDNFPTTKSNEDTISSKSIVEEQIHIIEDNAEIEEMNNSNEELQFDIIEDNAESVKSIKEAKSKKLTEETKTNSNEKEQIHLIEDAESVKSIEAKSKKLEEMKNSNEESQIHIIEDDAVETNSNEEQIYIIDIAETVKSTEAAKSKNLNEDTNKIEEDNNNALELQSEFVTIEELSSTIQANTVLLKNNNVEKQLESTVIEQISKNYIEEINGTLQIIEESTKIVNLKSKEDKSVFVEKCQTMGDAEKTMLKGDAEKLNEEVLGHVDVPIIDLIEDQPMETDTAEPKPVEPGEIGNAEVIYPAMEQVVIQPNAEEIDNAAPKPSTSSTENDNVIEVMDQDETTININIEQPVAMEANVVKINENTEMIKSIIDQLIENAISSNKEAEINQDSTMADECLPLEQITTEADSSSSQNSEHLMTKQGEQVEEMEVETEKPCDDQPVTSSTEFVNEVAGNELQEDDEEKWKEIDDSIELINNYLGKPDDEPIVFGLISEVKNMKDDLINQSNIIDLVEEEPSNNIVEQIEEALNETDNIVDVDLIDDEKMTDDAVINLIEDSTKIVHQIEDAVKDIATIPIINLIEDEIDGTFSVINLIDDFPTVRQQIEEAIKDTDVIDLIEDSPTKPNETIVIEDLTEENNLIKQIEEAAMPSTSADSIMTKPDVILIEDTPVTTNGIEETDEADDTVLLIDDDDDICLVDGESKDDDDDVAIIEDNVSVYTIESDVDQPEVNNPSNAFNLQDEIQNIQSHIRPRYHINIAMNYRRQNQRQWYNSPPNQRWKRWRNKRKRHDMAVQTDPPIDESQQQQPNIPIKNERVSPGIEDNKNLIQSEIQYNLFKFNENLRKKLRQSVSDLPVDVKVKTEAIPAVPLNDSGSTNLICKIEPASPKDSIKSKRKSDTSLPSSQEKLRKSETVTNAENTK